MTWNMAKRFGDTGAADVDTSYQGNPIIAASTLVGEPITLWEKRFSDSMFGPSCFVDFTYASDTDSPTLFTVVFSGKSPAYRQMKGIATTDLQEGVTCVIAESGKSFVLGDAPEPEPERRSASKRPSPPREAPQKASGSLAKSMQRTRGNPADEEEVPW